VHDPQEWITRLNMSGKPLSKGQKRIAEYISCHYEKAVSMTAVMLGKQCGVSESTVVRFAMALGYEGYPEMQEKLRSMVRQRLTAEQRVGMMEETDRREVVSTVLKNDLQNLRKTMDELRPQDFDMAVECILSARRLYIMGLRSSAPLAMFLYHYLHQIFDEVVLVQNLTGDVFEEIDRIQKGDVLFGISFPRYSSRTVKAMRFARDRGANVIALTDSEASPLAEIATETLLAKSDMASFVDSLVAPLSLVNALIVAVGRRKNEDVEQTFVNLEQIWSEYGVYEKVEE
jgi:DNA-binding MurR/RpiR family transcriptional regulator